MGAMAFQITSLTIVNSTVDSGADQRKHQSYASRAFVPEIHRWPVNSPHKWPVTRKMFPMDDVIIILKQELVCMNSWLGSICRDGICLSAIVLAIGRINFAGTSFEIVVKCVTTWVQWKYNFIWGLITFAGHPNTCCFLCIICMGHNPDIDTHWIQLSSHNKYRVLSSDPLFIYIFQPNLTLTTWFIGSFFISVDNSL